MTVSRARYELSKIDLNSLCRQFKEAEKNDFLNFDVLNTLNKYVSLLRSYFYFRVHLDFAGYGNKLQSDIKNNASLITNSLSTLLEKNILEKNLHDLFVRLTDLCTKSLSKKQYKHLQLAVYRLKNLMEGSESEDAQKILEDIEEYV